VEKETKKGWEGGREEREKRKRRKNEKNLRRRKIEYINLKRGRRRQR